jgi:putative ABC transport system substrate-binding protein
MLAPELAGAWMYFDRLKRRELISLLGSVGMAWPLAARAQQPSLRTIGLLAPGTVSSHGAWFAELARRLRELGWIESRNVAFEYRWAEGRPERYDEIAAELVRLKVDVIVTTAPVVPAVQRATSVIPIVFALSGDPVRAGLIASLARPGGNATGLSLLTPDTAGKRLEFLREVAPGVRRLALMVNVNFPDAVQESSEAQAAARALDLEVARHEIRRAADIGSSFESLKDWADALYVTGDPLLNTNRIRINTLALIARLPTVYSFREHVEAGGLISYGPNMADMFRRAAEYVDKILRGAKPADLPVEQPTKFDLIINLTTAKGLGLNIPEAFLLRADEVIE